MKDRSNLLNEAIIGYELTFSLFLTSAFADRSTNPSASPYTAALA